MHVRTRATPVAALLACCGRAPTESSSNRLAPPTLSIVASAHVVGSGGAAALAVAAVLRNATSSHIRVVSGAACPLVVTIFPDPTGEPTGAADASMACTAAAPSLDLAPGDSTTITRVVPADSLASRASGVYGVNAVVTTTTGVTGVWAGVVQLPL